MKKMLLGAVGLSAVLASCGDVGVVYEPVTITAINSFTSDYYRVVTDPTTGQPRNEYVICYDRPTTVYMDVSWNGPLSRLDARFEGASTNQTTTKTTGTFPVDTSGNDTFTYQFAAGAAPLSVSKGNNLGAQNLKPQAIIVNPVNKGTTYVTVWGYNPNGLKSNEYDAPGGIPVVTCG